MAQQLNEGEKIIDQWTLSFIGDERILSSLVISNQNVYFGEGMLTIPREDIARVESFRRFFIFQRFRIVTKSGKEFVFDRGIMPVGGIVSLLQEPAK